MMLWTYKRYNFKGEEIFVTFYWRNHFHKISSEATLKMNIFVFLLGLNEVIANNPPWFDQGDM